MMSWDASLVPRLLRSPVHQQNLSPCDEDLVSYPDPSSCVLKQERRLGTRLVKAGNETGNTTLDHNAN